MTNTAELPANATPVTLASIVAKLQAITVDMAFSLKRTSRSLYVKDGEDFCTSIAGTDGLMLTSPDSIGSTLLTLVDCSGAIAAVPDLGPGDVIITNDAHTSRAMTTHLADICVLAPYYVEGVLVGYGFGFIHASDMGGRVPSSISPFNQDVFQEGLQIPPMKLVKKGVFDQDIEAFIRANTRTPDANIADIRALLAALRAGESAISDLAGRYGVRTYLWAQEEILRLSDNRARELVRQLPPGTYRFSDYLDDDGASRLPVRYQVALEIGADGSTGVDFTGTDPQVPTAFNIVSAGRPNPMTTGRLRSVLTTLDPQFPSDGGSQRAINVRGPVGTVVNAVRPAAMGVRHGSAVRVADAIGGAMVKAAPRVMPTAGSGVVIPVVVSEARPEGRVSQVITRLFGGFGGAHGQDGHDGRDNGYSNLASSPVETSEAELNVEVLRYELRPDSGGAGQWRGGMGRTLTFRVDADGTQVLGRGLERFIFRPWGAYGGLPARPCEVVRNEGRTDEQHYRKLDVLPLNRGDTLTFRTPGGGGYGDPFCRDPAAVLDDVASGLVSLNNARELYGVVIGGEPDALQIDVESTTRLRTNSDRPESSEFDFGPERRQWDAVFGEEWCNALNRWLFEQPADRRHPLREWAFNQVLNTLPEEFPLGTTSTAQLDRASTEARRVLDGLSERN